jgi:predicted esterase
MTLHALLSAIGLLAAAAVAAQPLQDIPSADGSLAHAAWKPAGKVERWIVSLHGTGGSAKRDIEVWQKSVGGRPIAVLAIQWWRGQGDAYLPPFDIYREIDFAASKLGIQPGRALLHGFSRGSANLYAVAAIDQGRGRKLFSLYVASSGGVALDFPPTRAILEGRYGPRPLAGTRWVTACGGRDANPERDGCPGMRRTGAWLKEQGAQVLLAIEDAQSGHGALQLNPGNTARLLDLFHKKDEP